MLQVTKWQGPVLRDSGVCSSLGVEFDWCLSVEDSGERIELPKAKAYQRGGLTFIFTFLRLRFYFYSF